jgi:hypothetical protein
MPSPQITAMVMTRREAAEAGLSIAAALKTLNEEQQLESNNSRTNS